MNIVKVESINKLPKVLVNPTKKSSRNAVGIKNLVLPAKNLNVLAKQSQFQTINAQADKAKQARIMSDHASPEWCW